MFPVNLCIPHIGYQKTFKTLPFHTLTLKHRRSQYPRQFPGWDLTHSFTTTFFRSGMKDPGPLLCSCRYHTCTNAHTHPDTYIYTVHIRTLTHTHTCILTHTYIHPSIHTYIHSFNHSDIHTFIHSYIHTFLHSYIPTCIRTLIHTYIPTCLPTYLLTYPPTYIHTNIQTYIHTYIWIYIYIYIYIYYTILHLHTHTLYKHIKGETCVHFLYTYMQACVHTVIQIHT